ncbi:hypothetical protein [Streptomyces sp. bgisy100]
MLGAAIQGLHTRQLSAGVVAVDETAVGIFWRLAATRCYPGIIVD